VPAIAEEDRERLYGFLEAASGLTVDQWQTICERRAARKSQIRRADAEAQHIMIELMRTTGFADEPKSVRGENDRVNAMVRKISSAVPETGADIGGTTAFRKLVHLALAQAVVALRLYTACLQTKEGQRALQELTRPFDGIIAIK
jgi:hypothetical protein